MSIHLTLSPQKDDPELVKGEGGPYWRANSSDPAFLASTQGRPLARGWYRARTRIHPRTGRVAGPRLYVPHEGGGFSEFRSVELHLHGEHYTGEIFISHPTTEL